MGSTRPTVGAVLLALLVIALTGCGDGTDRDSTAADSAGGSVETVTIEEYLYEPARIVVPPGTTIAFANRDAAPHTATSKTSGAFDTGTIKKGESGEITLEKVGSFAYYCLFHPFMKGTVVVE